MADSSISGRKITNEIIKSHLKCRRKNVGRKQGAKRVLKTEAVTLARRFDSIRRWLSTSSASGTCAAGWWWATVGGRLAPMRPPVPDPYLPPAVDLSVVPPLPNEGGLAARVAGGFLLLRAVVSATTTLWRIVEQNSRELPGAAWVPMIVPAVLPLLVDGLLAAPLLRASVRFRVVTWVRALLAVVFPLAFAVGSVISPRLASLGLAGFHVQIALTTCFFAAGMILLVHRARRRWRLVAGIACLLLYVLAQGLPRLIAFGASS